MPVFLFTDIEGSTEKWEKHRAVMGPVLARHDALLRAAVTAHGGKVVKTTGDGIHAAFEGGEPLAAALAIQRAVQGEDWAALSGGAVPDLRVRVGLHAGDAESRDGDWYGPAVNRAARVMAAAHGGQVLVSATVLEACRLPPDAASEDFGPQRLKDLEESLRLHGLYRGDLPLRKFPALKTLSSRPHNLPVQPTPFVGREEELKHIATLLANPDCRLLTLLGLGGMGKTRLALQAAAEAADGFTDGVFAVFLAPLGEVREIAHAAMAALGGRLHGERDPQEQLVDLVRGKAQLLVFDNFEHLPDAALLLTKLLSAAPKLKVLVTSRERLHLQAEQILDVRGMEVSSGTAGSGPVRLFIQAARRVQPGLTLGESAAAAIVRICHLVDGMPLGIELAASWARTLSVQEIAAEIERNADFLASSLRDVPERQRSFRAVFEYSWKLLTEPERSALIRLSALRGGFRREAAECVADAKLGTLQSLLDKSLLTRSAGGRFSFHELLRQYAVERLRGDGDLFQRTQADACAYYLGLLAAGWPRLTALTKTRSDDGILAELAEDQENIRDAWWTAMAQGDRVTLDQVAEPIALFWDLREQFDDARIGLAKSLEILESSPDSPKDLLWARLRAHYGRFCLRLALLREATPALQEGAALAHDLGAKSVQAEALLDLGEIASRLANHIGALDYRRRARWAAKESGDARLLGRALLSYGDYLCDVRGGSGLAEAESCLRESEQCFVQSGDTTGQSKALFELSTWAMRSGKLPEARQFARQALDIVRHVSDDWIAIQLRIAALSRQLGDIAEADQLERETLATDLGTGRSRRETAFALLRLGRLASKRNETTEADRLVGASLRIFQEIGDRQGIGLCLWDQASLAFGVGDHEKAEALFRNVLVLLKEMGNTSVAAECFSLLADMARKRGAQEAARQWLAAWITFMREQGDLRLEVGARRAAATFELTEGRDRVASGILEEGMGFADQTDDVRSRGWLRYGLADVFKFRQEWTEATSYLEEAGALFRRGIESEGVAWAHASLGEVLARCGATDQARDMLRKAISEFVSIGSGVKSGLDWCNQLLKNLDPRRQDTVREEREALAHATGAARREVANAERVGDGYALGWALYRLADRCKEFRDWPGAHTSLEQAVAIFMKLPDEEGRAWALASLGETLMREGMYQDAAKRVAEAQQIFSRIGPNAPKGLDWCTYILSELGPKRAEDS